MKNFHFKLILTLSVLLLSMPLFAQIGPPGVPIDGGLLSIVGAGIGYGVYRKMKGKK